MDNWSDDEVKILEMVLEEWFEEFRKIFSKNKKSDVDNFVFYAKHSFMYNNVFRYAVQIINNHKNWEEWEERVIQFYLKKCIFRRISIFSSKI